MKTNSASYCKHFYHGVNQVVCGLYPYGSDSKTCSDHVPQISNLGQGQIRRSWIICQFDDYKGWKKLLMVGLLVAHFEIIKELGENGGSFFATINLAM